MKSLLLYLFFILQFILCSLLTLEDLDRAFQFEKCIQGSLSHVDQTVGIATSSSKLIQGVRSKGITLEELSLFNISKIHEKSSMSQIHELAQYNEIEYEYKLVSEEGPSHNKLFRVQLLLGDESYEGESKTIKKAQQYAASIALQNTKYERKPEIIDEAKITALTPTVKLNNIAAKLGLSVEYSAMNTVEGKMITYKNVDINPGHTYLNRLNHSIYHAADKHVEVEATHLTRGPFNVRVLVDNMEFIGSGHTIQAARHDAAQKAIDYLKEKGIHQRNACTTEGSENECRKMKENIKSPISKIHETGQKHKLEVNFQVIRESGPAHKKLFTTQCTLGDFITEGDGHSKKESKRVAAEKMLDNLSFLPYIDDTNEIVNSLKPKKKKKKKKKLARLNEKEDSDSFFDKLTDSSWNVFGFEEDNAQNGDINNHNSDDKSSGNENFKHKKQDFTSSQDAKDALLNIGAYLGFEVNLHDLGKKDNEFYTLVSLGVHPPYLCFGKSMNQELSATKATLESIKLLLKNGLENKLYRHLKDKEYISFLIQDLNRHLSHANLKEEGGTSKDI